MADSGSARVDVAREGHVLLLTLANEAKANALTPDMLDTLTGELASIGDEARVVLLIGAGDRNFSSGVDLGGAPDPVALRTSEARLGAAAQAIRSSPVPVVAVLNGSAFGGALELAMACDWRVAVRGSRFGMPPGRLGVVYTPRGLALFVAAIGPAHAAELFVTGEPVDSDRAHAIGLVNAVVEPGELMAYAHASGERVAAMAPLSVRGTIATIRDLAGGALDRSALARAEEWRERAYASEDLAEGLAAFRDRRAPRFTGR